MLTYEEVASVLEYSPTTGKLKWQSSGRGRKADRSAGNFNKSLGYVEIKVKGYRTYAHRIAWLLTYGVWPDKHIDHINGIKDDNRIENLRVVNNQQNHTNMKQHKGNSSGVTGVYWSKRAKKWQAYICVKGKQKYLGIFKYLKDAETARKEAETEYGYHKNHGRVTA